MRKLHDVPRAHYVGRRSNQPAVMAISISLLLSLPASAAAGNDALRWGTYPESIEEILRTYPSADANEMATDVERLSADLGIDVAPKAIDNRPRPGKDPLAKFSKVREAIGDYLASNLQRADSGVSVPVPDAAEFLVDHEAAIDRLAERLTHGDPPRWERHLEKLNEAPIPNLLGLLSLHRTLLADALFRESRGDEAGALEVLDASWTLNTALSGEPFVVDQLVAIAIVRMQVGAIRHLSGTPPVWIDRLREHDYRESLLAALQLEGWMWKHMEAPPSFDGNKSFVSRIGAIARGPYFRTCMENTAEIWSRQLVRLAEARHPCDADPDSLNDLVNEIPWWNRFGEDLVKNLSGAMVRVARLEVDLELTSRALELQAARRTIRAWPAALSAGMESVACPGSHWIYAPAPGDERSIALDRDIMWRGLTGTILPSRYVTSESPVRK